MSKRINIKEFLSQTDSIPIIDVRSPGEYKKAHIPGAFNIPLFDDEERAKVGTSYKQKNRESAILLGLEFVGPKMKALAIKAKSISKNNNLLIYCWRGGMRSGSMAWLFSILGLNVQILEGGYKAYRAYLKSELSQTAKIKILSGYTGSGKTDILKFIEKQGNQIIDLEGLAHHKGSAFGYIGAGEQLPSQQFENNLFQVWSKLDKNKTIWIEDESKAIGKNYIPDELFVQMRNAEVIKIHIEKDIRIKRLVKEYTQVDKELLIFQLNRISKRLGSKETKQAIDAIQKNDMTEAVNIALSFYDKAYLHGLSKRDSALIKEIKINEDKPEQTASYLLSLTTKS